MNWGYPGYITLGILLALLVLGGSIAVWLHRERVLALFVSKDRVQELTAAMPGWEYWTRTGLIMGAVILGCLALASPRWGYVLEKSNANSLDILIAVDTSRSMLADDLVPSRMKRTQLAIQELLKLGEGDRFGLIPFAGSAFLQCPLTVDQEALRQHVNLVNVDLIPEGGTNLGEAIKAAMETYEEHEEDSHKVLILFSDGEDHDENAVAMAREAANQGLRIFTIGTGAAEGSLIPTVYCGSCETPNIPGRNICRVCSSLLRQETDFVRDEDGAPVRSKLNEPMLEELAEETGGFYLRLEGARTMEVLYKNGLAPLPKSENTSTMVRRQRERYQWPLGGAVLLLLLEMLWPMGRRPRGVSATATALLLAVCLPLTASAASLKEAARQYQKGEYALALEAYEELLRLDPGDAQLHYNAGAAAYKAAKHNEAAKHFRAALRTPDLSLQHGAFYNLGNTHFRLGAEMQNPEDQIPAWEEAAKFYEAALELNGKDPAAQRNLNFVQQKITEAKQKLDQLSSELELDGVTRFKNQEDKKFALRIFPPDRKLIPERPYWRMFVLDHYEHGVAKVSDSLRAQSIRAEGTHLSQHGGRPAAGLAQPGEWRFRFEPLFSEFLPMNGSFEQATVATPWHYNSVALQGRLPEVPTKAVEYRLTNPHNSAKLTASPLDAALDPEQQTGFEVEDRTAYPFTTLAINVTGEEKAKLLGVIDLLTGEAAGPLSLEEFNNRVIGWLHANHKYTRQTRIPEDEEQDPVVKWMLGKSAGHCEYFAYSYVLLARTAGYPARMVCGFAGGEWDDRTASWTNQQTDAHAWAEVFDGEHWLRVEPTPPENPESQNGEGEQNQDPQEPNEGNGDQNPDPNGQNGQNQDDPQNGEGNEHNEDRDEGELPPELLETLRQAQQLLDAMKGDEKPLSAVDSEKAKRGIFKRRPKKDW